MNKLHEAVYIGSRNFCRQHPDIFVFSEFDSDRQQVKLTIEYNGGFAIYKEFKDTTKYKYVFGPRVSHFLTYGDVLKSKTPHVMIHTLLSNMHAELMNQYDLTFMDKWKASLGSV